MLLAIHPLATTDAALNATAAILLIVGLALIKQRRERAHKWTMLTAFAVSSVFLGCYLYYHFTTSPVHFAGHGLIQFVYFAILYSHIALALTVPPLAIATIYFGLRDRRAKHRRLARWTYPIWLCVSVTGVIVYVMLYHLFPGTG